MTDYLQTIAKAISSPVTARTLVHQGMGSHEDVYAALVALEAKGEARVVVDCFDRGRMPVCYWESMQ